jgi:hypothetical protein
MGILDKALQIVGLGSRGQNVSPEELKGGNPNITTFAELDNEDEVLSNSVLVNEVYGNADSAQFNTIKGYKQAVYGTLSTDKIRRLTFFREMALYPEVSDAIDEISEACINNDEQENIVQLKYTTISDKLPKEVKTEIENHAEHFLSLFDFEGKGFDYFRRLVIDGEVTWENIIDHENEDLGLIGVNYVRSETYEYLIDDNYRHHGIIINAKLLNNVGGDDVPQYKFDRNRIGSRWRGEMDALKWGGNYQRRNANKEMIVMPNPQITHANSGNFNYNNTVVEPVLERARRPYRQLSLLEDASIIYRLVRAPERLVFNVDTGRLPPARAEEAVFKMMRRYNTQRVYDPTTGDLANGYDPHSMLEAYWFPKPSDGAGGTEVDSIGGQGSFGDLEDLQYFQRKLFVSLKIPYNRFDPEAGEEKTDGESISYEEYRFSKFIMRIQSRMAKALEESFKVHLQLVGLWDKYNINERMFNIEFVKPTSYDLYNQQRILNVKLDNYDAVANHDEFSKELAQKKYLGWTDAEIEKNRKAVEVERLAEAYIERKVDNISDHGYPEDEDDAEELGMGMGF